MLNLLFSQLSNSENQHQAISSGACLIVKKNQARKSEVECLLINVTGLTPESINDIAQASVKAVSAAKGE